jgi:hypothetical protein
MYVFPEGTYINPPPTVNSFVGAGSILMYVFPEGTYINPPPTVNSL